MSFAADWNHVEGFVGDRGTGKSTAAILRALDLSRRAGGCYILAWDLMGRMPAKLPGGRPAPILDCDRASWEAVRAALVAAKGGIVRVAASDGSRVLEIGRRLGRAGGAPVLVVIDEAALWDSAGTARLGDDLREFLAVARHDRCGLLWCAQAAGLVHKRLIGLSTRLWLFKQGGKQDRDRLIDGNVPATIVDQLSGLPPHRAIVVEDGLPIDPRKS